MQTAYGAIVGDQPDREEPTIPCPDCGLHSPTAGLPLDDQVNASGECRQLYWQRSADTLIRSGPAFMHQFAVDAYAAQHAGGNSKPITTAFALVGLLLACERGFSGRDVQQAHTLLARWNLNWPRFSRPEQPTSLTIADVAQANSAAQRDRLLAEWAAVVWASWCEERERVIALVNQIPR